MINIIKDVFFEKMSSMIQLLIKVGKKIMGEAYFAKTDNRYGEMDLFTVCHMEV